MSEAVEYDIKVSGFKDEEEGDSFFSLAQDFDGDLDVYQEYDRHRKRDEFVLLYKGTSRGGGKTCKQILVKHFSSWLDEHPHVSFKAWARYVEQAPYVIEFEREGR